MTIYEDEGRAPIVLDYAFHEINPLPVDVQEGITISGLAVDIELGAVEIKDASTENRATVTAAGDLQITLAGEPVDTELPVAALLGDVVSTPTAPAVGAFGMAFDAGGGDWARMRQHTFTTDSNTSTNRGLLTASYQYGYDRDIGDWTRMDAVIIGQIVDAGANGFSVFGSDGSNWYPLLTDATGQLIVDTELPAAAALSDTFVNPTAPAVGSFGMGWNKVLGQWVRIQTMDPGDPDHVSVATDDGWQIVYSANAGWDSGVLRGVAASLPDADGLGVVAEHGIHSLAHGYGFNGTTWDRLRVDATGNLLTTVSGLSIQVDSEFPAAIALSDTMANPTTTSVGSFNMGWSKTLAQWVRLQTMDAGGDTFSPISDDGVQVVFAAVAGLSGAIWRQAAVDQPNLDGLPATNFGLNVNSHALGFNGTTWDRLRSTTAAGLEVDVTNASIATTVSGLLAVNVAGNDADAVAHQADNVLDTNSFLMAYDEQSDYWSRTRMSHAPTTDGQIAADMAPVLGVGSYPSVFNGTTWDRQRGTSGSANVLVLNTSNPSDSSSTNTGLNTIAAQMLYKQTADNYHRWRADETGRGQVSLYGQDVAAGDTAVAVTSQGFIENVPRVDATVLRASIAASGIGSNTLVPASGGLKVKLLSVMLSATNTVTARFESDGGADLSGDLTLDAAGAGFVLNPPSSQDMHWMESVVGEALVLDLDSAVYVGGMITYYYEA